jgi:hypothetical protein
MDIIHPVTASALPRHAQSTLASRLRTMPAAVVTGARQTGKSTLAHDLTPGTRRFVSLDARRAPGDPVLAHGGWRGGRPRRRSRPPAHPIEVKATPRPRLRDAVPLRAFRAEYVKAGGAAAAHGERGRMADARRPGRAVVAGMLNPGRPEKLVHDIVTRVVPQ